MRAVCGSVAVAAILVCIISPLRVFFGMPSGDYEQDFSSFKTLFNGATLLWFLSAPYWMAPDLFTPKPNDEDNSES